MKQWGPFNELKVDNPDSKEIPANCSRKFWNKHESYWNPNPAGKRNKKVQAICAVIGKHIPVWQRSISEEKNTRVWIVYWPNHCLTTGWPDKTGCRTKPANCKKLGQKCKSRPVQCCPGLMCKRRKCVKAGGGGKPCKPKNYPCKSPSDCCSKRCRKYGSRKKCA